jgi:hypothetical protein
LLNGTNREQKFTVATILMMGWIGATVSWGVGIWEVTSMADTGFLIAPNCSAKFLVLDSGYERSFFALYLALVNI